MSRLKPFFVVIFLAAGILRANQASALTAAGTTISVTATNTFQDQGGTNYSVSSNTVTLTVQNAPSLTMVAPSNQNVTPGMEVVDTFTLTNTGNASGTFALPSDATFAGTASGTMLLGYVLAGASTGTCSVAAPCTSSTLNAQSGMAGIAAAGGTVTIGVEYSVSGTATNNQTIITTLTATVAYASLTGAAAETSANTTAGSPPTDTIKTDARLDVQAGASISGSNIIWTVTANNGGGYTAQGLAAAKTVLGASNNGIVIFMQTPSYNSTYLTLQATPSAPTLNGASSGAAGAWYYNAAACSTHPTSGWSATYGASSKCLAVYVSNTTANVLPSATSGSSGAGSVSTAQITASFTTNQPSGNGSGNANAVTLVADSAIGGNSWVTGSVPILGQGLAVGASTDAATAALLNGIQTNTTASSGTTPPGGASNQAGGNATLAYSLIHGPYANAGATGWYPGATGTPAADTSHDFTAYNVPCTSNAAAGVNGLLCTVSSTGVIIVNEVSNTGNSSDSVQLTATAPTGYLVQLYTASACSGGGSTWPSCTQGAALTSQSTSGGSVNATVTVASGAVYDYEAVYNASGNSATPFTAYTTQLTAAGQNGAGTGSDTNNTFNVLYPGGVVKLTNAVTATSTNCPSSESAPPVGLACPGGTLSYTVAYANVVPASTASNLGTEPAFAYNPCYTTAGSLVITDDGTASPGGATAANNWPTYTNALAAAATDTTTGTVFTYYPSASTTFSANQTKFTAQIGGSSYQLSPGGSGTVTFTAVVK